MSTRKIRVLIVDDSLFMRAAIAKTLGGAFEIVGHAKNGSEALAVVGRLAPDVITMDFNMPGMNGADTIRALMQQRPTPVVMFSAHTKQGAKETFDALAAGAVDFVTKPAGEVSSPVEDRPRDASQLTAASQSKPSASRYTASYVGPDRRASLAVPRASSAPHGSAPADRRRLHRWHLDRPAPPRCPGLPRGPRTQLAS